MNDAGSLQNLNDIVMPGTVPLWPPAPGWYVLASIVAIILLYLSIRWWNARCQNRYRRQALAELAQIRKSKSGASLEALPDLIKRAALAAWPRDRVASLSGSDWHRFLDESAGGERFCTGAGTTLDWLAYRTNVAGKPSDEDIARVLDASEFWLKNHAVQQAEI